MYLLVYVDDIIITDSDTSMVNQVISSLAARFSVKDLGNLNYFLGVKVIRKTDHIILSQSNYISDILHEEKMVDCKSAKTPMSPTQVHKINDGGLLADATTYRRVIEKHQYLSFTYPDICFSVNKLSQFIQTPSKTHWKAVKRVLWYLQGTTHF